MFQTNNDSLYERKVMTTIPYYNTYNYLQQVEIKTMHSHNDVAHFTTINITFYWDIYLHLHITSMNIAPSVLRFLLRGHSRAIK